MPRRPNNTACRVHAIMPDLGSGEHHASDALAAASVKSGPATLARTPRTRRACSVVVPYISVGSVGCCLASVGRPVRQPCDQALLKLTKEAAPYDAGHRGANNFVSFCIVCIAPPA